MSFRLPEKFNYKRGSLYCENISIPQLAAKLGSPLYIYSKNALIERVKKLKHNLPSNCDILFAVKACSNIHILKLLRQQGCGADIVSGGELFRSALAGIPARKTVFSGVGKTEEEILLALKAGIDCFNVESADELFLIEKIAAKYGARPNTALRINPDINPKTHPYISTGLRRNKFGLSKQELAQIYRRASKLKHVRLRGLSCHIGSQITDTKPLVEAWTKLIAEAERAPFEVTHLDLGGGLGISYGNEPVVTLEDYGKTISHVFKKQRYKLSIEPGRSLTGPCAVLLTRLITVKKRGSRSFFVVDAAMNDLIRPALYRTIHPFIPVKMPSTRIVTADIVGPICESGDTFQIDAKVSQSKSGDLFAFANAGAYAMSMASQYNARPRAAEVLVSDDKYRLIRERETYADLIQRELL